MDEQTIPIPQSLARAYIKAIQDSRHDEGAQLAYEIHLLSPADIVRVCHEVVFRSQPLCTEALHTINRLCNQIGAIKPPQLDTSYETPGVAECPGHPKGWDSTDTTKEDE